MLLKPSADYHDEYAAKVAELLERFPLGEQIIGETAQKQFIALLGGILRLRNILQSFDDFADDQLLSDREMQYYTSIYLDLYAEFRVISDADKESIIDDVVFEDLIEAFVDSLSATAEVDVAWQAYIAARRREELDRIIAEEDLKPEATYAFVDFSFRDEALQPSGTAIAKILPPMSRFAAADGHASKKQNVLAKLTAFFDRFVDLVSATTPAEPLQRRDISPDELVGDQREPE